MDRLAEHLENIEKLLGSTKVMPESTINKLEWHLNAIKEALGNKTDRGPACQRTPSSTGITKHI